VRKIRKIFFKTFILCYLLFVICGSVAAGNKLDVIVIDPGHGGKDPGTIGITGVQEKNIVLPIALKLGAMIQKKFPDIKIIYTRANDDFPSLKERTKLANDNKAKLFISIHANHKKQEESDKNGFEIYMVNKEHFPEAIEITMRDNRLLSFQKSGFDSTDNIIFSTLAQYGYYRYNEYFASFIEMNMLNYTQLQSRGVYQAGFWVILGASMPSILVETGYVSDANDEKYLSSGPGQTSIASALFNAFSNYKLLYEMQ
jgi:N-acetylmuramoyl-L-alanine amidase